MKQALDDHANESRIRLPGGVLLLHGIWRRSSSMRAMERALRTEGLATLNLDYPGRRMPLEALAEDVRPSASGFAAGLDGPLHVVTHSMGGLVARALLARWRPAKLGRVVMLGPPNRGSEVADLLDGRALYRFAFGPAGAQLTTLHGRSLARAFGPVDYPVGIVAGSRSVDPLASLVLPRPHDGRVSVEATRLDGMTDHVVIPVAHPFMPSDPRAIRLVLAFLRDGRFARRTGPLPRRPRPLISRPS